MELLFEVAFAINVLPLCVLELQNVQHCLLLTIFQPPDQIDVGQDGFKQWDGKNGVRCRKQ